MNPTVLTVQQTLLVQVANCQNPSGTVDSVHSLASSLLWKGFWYRLLDDYGPIGFNLEIASVRLSAKIFPFVCFTLQSLQDSKTVEWLVNVAKSRRSSIISGNITARGSML